MKTISNNIVHYKLIALIPLIIGLIATALFFVLPKEFILYPLCIGIIGFLVSAFMFWKIDNTIILLYNSEDKQIIIKTRSEEIIVQIKDIISFQKELDSQLSYPDFMDTSKSVYGISVKHNGEVRKFSFAIWDSQGDFQDNYANLRMHSIIERKKQLQ
jgi:hypothetical protein